VYGPSTLNPGNSALEDYVKSALGQKGDRKTVEFISKDIATGETLLIAW